MGVVGIVKRYFFEGISIFWFIGRFDLQSLSDNRRMLNWDGLLMYGLIGIVLMKLVELKLRSTFFIFVSEGLEIFIFGEGQFIFFNVFVLKVIVG